MGRSGGDLPIQVGDVLHGKYAVEITLGEGGMGVVLGGRDVASGTKVAIKVMKSELLSSPEAIARFEREAKAACALQSEHVAKVLDAGRTPSGEPFIVMEYLLGSSLAGLVAQQKRLDPREVVDLALDVCDALVEAHALGIIHRDLKPDNIFVVERSDGARLAKVLDFGIAKVDNAALAGTALTTTGSMLGTPWYMAPEQLDTKRGVTPKTDVWALGATLYNALTGETPFQAESFYELSIKVYAHEPTPITEHRPSLPKPLADLIHACLQKDVARRLSLEEVAKRLEELRSFDDGEISTEPDQKKLASAKRTRQHITRQAAETPTETKAVTRPAPTETKEVPIPGRGAFDSATMLAATPSLAPSDDTRVTAVAAPPMTARIEATPMGPFTPATALLLARPSAPPPPLSPGPAVSARGSTPNVPAFGPGMGTVSPYTTGVPGQKPPSQAAVAFSRQLGVAFVIGLIAFGTVAGIVMRTRGGGEGATTEPTGAEPAPMPVPMDPATGPAPTAPTNTTFAAAPPTAPEPTAPTAPTGPVAPTAPSGSTSTAAALGPTTPAAEPTVPLPTAAVPSAATSASAARTPATVVRKLPPPPPPTTTPQVQPKPPPHKPGGGALTHER